MPEQPTVLFVDDERNILISLKALFRGRYRILLANSGTEAIEILKRERIHVLVSDQRMPGMEGVELLRQAKLLSPSTLRLLLTGYADLKAIVDSINEGEVFRFINKPWDNDALRALVDLAMRASLDSGDKAEPSGQTTAIVLDDAGATTLGLSRQHPSAKAPIDPILDAGILVLDDGEDAVQQVQRLVGIALPVYGANCVEAALDYLKTAPIGVVIAEVEVGGVDTTDFIKLLKAEHPAVMTIVLTQQIDAGTAVELINQGQVFRYLRKPVGDNWLRLALQQGMQFYQRHCQDPRLLARHQVEPIKPRQPSLAAKMMSQIKSLGLRWFSSARA